VRQEIQIVLHPGSTRSMRISTGIYSLAMTPPNAFFKTYLMCNSAAPPPQHPRKLTLYFKRGMTYIPPKTTSKIVAIASLLLLIA